MKKIIYFLLIICVCTFGNNKMVFAEGQDYVKALYSTVVVFSEPNIATASEIAEVTYGTKFLLKDVNQIDGDDGLKYYLVELSNVENYTEGYVLCSQVISIEYASPKRELSTNATLANDANVYTHVNSQYNDTGVILKAGERIKLLDGYIKELEYSRIQYKDLDGDIFTAYIKTENIKVSGISRTTIGAIIIIVSTVSLTLVLFGIKGKKKKVK